MNQVIEETGCNPLEKACMRVGCDPMIVTYTRYGRWSERRPPTSVCRSCGRDIPMTETLRRCCRECGAICVRCWATGRV